MVTSADGSVQFRLRGQLDADGRLFVADHSTESASTFFLRRVRPIFDLTFFKRVDVRFLTDFVDNKLTLFDGYAEVRVAPALRVRFGKFKSPVGFERLQTAAYLHFTERAASTLLAPNRDLGLMASGDLAGGRVSYNVAVLNGAPDFVIYEADTDNAKDLVARVSATPFLKSTGRAGVLAGLGVGLAASRGPHHGTTSSPLLPIFITAGRQNFFKFRVTGTNGSPVLADGTAARLTPQLTYFHGPVGVWADWICSSQTVRSGTATAEYQAEAWQAKGIVVLTGEPAGYSGIVPKRPFKPSAGDWGAFEVVARVSRWSVGDEIFPEFADPSVAARRLREAAVGVNWYLNTNLKVMMDYMQETFAGGAPDGDRVPERLIITRFQVTF